MDNYFFKENIVVQIYDFFKNNNFQSSNPVTIYNFLEGKEGFIIKDEKGLGRMKREMSCLWLLSKKVRTTL